MSYYLHDFLVGFFLYAQHRFIPAKSQQFMNANFSIFPFFYLFYPFSEIFDIMTEGQQFEFLGFTLNPVIRNAIMRKVCFTLSCIQVFFP